MSNKIFEFLNDKTSVVDGLEGKFEYYVINARYPYVHEIHKLRFLPSVKAKQTEMYQSIKQKLGDDWDIDLTDSIDTFVDQAFKLGYKLQPEV